MVCVKNWWTTVTIFHIIWNLSPCSYLIEHRQWPPINGGREGESVLPQQTQVCYNLQLQYSSGKNGHIITRGVHGGETCCLVIRLFFSSLKECPGKTNTLMTIARPEESPTGCLCGGQAYCTTGRCWETAGIQHTKCHCWRRKRPSYPKHHLHSIDTGFSRCTMGCKTR